MFETAVRIDGPSSRPTTAHSRLPSRFPATALISRTTSERSTVSPKRSRLNGPRSRKRMSHVARLEAAAVTGAPAWTIEAVVVLDAVFAALEEEPDDNVAGMSVK